jgi:hypothetical protein
MDGVNQDQTITPEVMKEEIEIAPKQVPVTVDDFTSLPEEQGIERVAVKHKIIDTLRRASIMLTSPQDWLLFKAEDRVTAYLQDSGCARIAPLWGIEITPVGDFVTITDDEKPGEYAVKCEGDGYCNVTQLFVKNVIGVRYSTDDVVKDLPTLVKKVRTQQNSIANRNGNIIRLLAGMKSVAIEEIDSVYKAEGKGKTTALCVAGRGFGSRADRQGAGGKGKAPSDIPAPMCDVCQKTMKFVDGTGKQYESFWSCPDKKKVDGKWNEHSSINDKKYRESIAAGQKDRETGMEG